MTSLDASGCAPPASCRIFLYRMGVHEALERVDDPPFDMSWRGAHVLLQGPDRRKAVLPRELFVWDLERYVVLDDESVPAPIRCALGERERRIEVNAPVHLFKALFAQGLHAGLMRHSQALLIALVCVLGRWLLPDTFAFAPSFPLGTRDLQVEHLAATVAAAPRLSAPRPAPQEPTLVPLAPSPPPAPAPIAPRFATGRRTPKSALAPKPRDADTVRFYLSSPPIGADQRFEAPAPGGP
jgi:hypothetical protein